VTVPGPARRADARRWSPAAWRGEQVRR